MAIRLKDTANITAKSASSATSATKTTQDSAGQQINTTYIKGLSVSGKTITYTKGDGSTGTITTQDTNTTYSTGTASALGLTKLYTGTGTATDGTMTQAAIKTALDGKAASSHTHNYAGSSSAGGAANTAVKLHTARTINGTSFDGSGNITTSQWGTARNLTIGNTAKSVNGSANVSWSLSEIGAAAASHGRHVPDVCTTITDWNAATTNGWYMGNNAANAPTSGSNVWYFGEVVAHNTNYLMQTVYQFTASADAKAIPKYIRARTNGTWGAWTNVTVSIAVPSNAKFTDTNTWRGVQDNLTSTATDQSLSANQGKVLKGLVDGKANSSHTHNYAGSSSAGGNANAAVKLATARTINGTNFDGSGNITTANWGTARTLTIGAAGKSVNGSGNVSWTWAEMQVPRAYSASYGFGGNQNAITTAQFITLLTNAGAFSQPYWISRGSWSYASNQYINDTGCGNIHLAGCVVEVIGTSSAYTIRVTTPTTTSNGTNNAEFIYINNGADYSPGWRRQYNTKNKPTPAEIGAAAASHGNHVPTTQTADARKFLRNDNTWQSLPTASTSATGIVQLNDATNSTSTTQAATANAVKKAYDLANGKANASHGNHVPATETANARKFLRNDNTWQTLPSASTSATGIVQLNNTVTSTSTSQAATANAVKLAYDKANEAFQSGNNVKQQLVDALVALKVKVTTSDSWDKLISSVSGLTNTKPSFAVGVPEVVFKNLPKSTGGGMCVVGQKLYFNIGAVQGASQNKSFYSLDLGTFELKTVAPIPYVTNCGAYETVNGLLYFGHGGESSSTLNYAVPTDTMQIYNPTSNAWTTKYANLGSYYACFTCSSVYKDSIIFKALMNGELRLYSYNTSSNTYTIVSGGTSRIDPRRSTLFSVLGDALYMSFTNKATQKFVFATNTLTTMNNEYPGTMYGGASFELDNLIYCMGGTNSTSVSNIPLDETSAGRNVHVFDTVNNRWTTTSIQLNPRSYMGRAKYENTLLLGAGWGYGGYLTTLEAITLS